MCVCVKEYTRVDAFKGNNRYQSGFHTVFFFFYVGGGGGGGRIFFGKANILLGNVQNNCSEMELDVKRSFAHLTTYTRGCSPSIV